MIISNFIVIAKRGEGEKGGEGRRREMGDGRRGVCDLIEDLSFQFVWRIGVEFENEGLERFVLRIWSRWCWIRRLVLFGIFSLFINGNEDDLV